MGKQLVLFKDIPFVDEVEEFNLLMNKPNNYEPTIPEKKEWEFVYDFVLEELEEYREACERGDIVEILDALCDITYVSLGNGTICLLYTSPSPRDRQKSRMPSSA